MKTFITTGGRPDSESISLAKEASAALGYEVIDRKKRAIARLQEECVASILVAGKNRYDLYRLGMKEPFFFHPNSAAFRLKRLVNQEVDPLIETAQLANGDSFLDCTLGIGSDSIIASYIVGETGRVTGIEADRDVAFITKMGLQSFPTKSELLKLSMSRIQVVNEQSIDFLRRQENSSWDIVYLDPMFHAPIMESSNFSPLRQVGVHSVLTDEWMEESFRVSKRGVVLKDRFDSTTFNNFGFERKVRPNTKFHFGLKRKSF